MHFDLIEINEAVLGVVVTLTPNETTLRGGDIQRMARRSNGMALATNLLSMGAGEEKQKARGWNLTDGTGA